jgi:hypothetical protein
MKKLLLIGAVAAMAAVGTANANTIRIFTTPFNGGLQGGEFKAVTDNNGTFMTFCMEYNEHLAVGFPYTYKLNDRAIAGGANHDLTTPGADILSQGSAYLYEMFARNTLPGYPGLNHSLNAGQLQLALWALEDEQTFAQAGGMGNPFLALAVTHFGSFALAQDNYAGPAVKVVNIYDDGDKEKKGTENRQDVIIYIPQVPDGGLTVALLGLALVSVEGIRRKLRK